MTDRPEGAGAADAMPLPPIRVLDVADGWGAHCGRILADLGADVVKVEPPSGESARSRPPFLDDVPGPDRSLWWIALNANKRGVTLDLTAPRGRELFIRLAARADVVIEAFPPGRFDELGVGYAVLHAANPELILASVTPYGQDGPLAGVSASDLEVTATSGSLWLAGEPGKAPVRMTLPQSHFWAGMYAAMATLLAYLARDAVGGQHVDVSAQASMATVHAPAPLFWDQLREDHTRLGPYLIGRSRVGARFRNIWRCKDGHVAFAIQGGTIGRHTGKELTAWMSARGAEAPLLLAMDWDSFDNQTLTQQEVDRLEAEVDRFFRTLTKAEFFAEVVARNMLGYPVAAADDIYRDPQLQARDFWQDVPLADGRSLRFPGVFALFDGARPAIRRPPPRLGEHNAEVLAELGLATEAAT